MKPTTIIIMSIVLLSLRSLPAVAHLADASIPIPEQPLARVTCFEVREGYLDRFQKVLYDYVLGSLSDEGNIMAEAYYDEANHSVLWLIERWNSKEAYDQFSQDAASKAVNRVAELVLAKPARTIGVQDLEPISKQAWRKASAKEDGQLTIMLFVDAKEGTQQQFKDVYKVAMPQFRSEPGVVTYQLSELEEDPTQFITFEKFRSDNAFQYHLNFPPIQPVIDYLNSSIKKPPFQNGVHRLIEFAPLIRE